MTRLERLSDTELAVRAAVAQSQGRRARLAACEAEIARRKSAASQLAARMGQTAQSAQVTRVMCENTVRLPVPDVMPWHGVPHPALPDRSREAARIASQALSADFTVKPRKRATRKAR